MSAREPENLDLEIAGDGMVTIVEARTEFEAGVIVAVLADAGIEAHAFDHFRQTLPFQSRFSRVPVQVAAVNAVRAREALAQRAAESREIDWDQVDVGERQDRLPLGSPGEMSTVARTAFGVALALIFLTLAMMLVAAIM